MLLDPPRKEGLPTQYPPVMLNYPLVPKFIETLAILKITVVFEFSVEINVR